MYHLDRVLQLYNSMAIKWHSFVYNFKFSSSSGSSGDVSSFLWKHCAPRKEINKIAIIPRLRSKVFEYVRRRHNRRVWYRCVFVQNEYIVGSSLWIWKNRGQTVVWPIWPVPASLNSLWNLHELQKSSQEAFPFFTYFNKLEWRTCISKSAFL